ncbi:MAG: MATE family efflux transporter [Bacteroides sp.]|nr:MATE family efflux transporter [Bacillota bacterium]MCM1394044.1 MATE family efflux transporter [[Eubacterium] siraeum]MCM1455496.1 MATE family efflux transporter [Bacteroides sp.]
MQDSKFLGEEKIPKLMVKFCVPCVLSLLISALYNIVDQIFIGNSELGTLGNAATGVVFPIFIIAQAFAWWFGDGCAAYLNICQGKGDTQNANKAVGSGITLTVIASLVLIAVFMPLKRQMLTLFGASKDSIGYAVEYFVIILSFFPIYMASNMINAVVRADGSPSWSMASMLAGALVNIALDPLFIFAFKWGMKGAAWATVIGQIVSFVISVVYLLRTKTFKLKLKSFIPNFKVFGKSIQLGLSSFITQMTIVVISLVCNILLAKYGAQSHYGQDIPIALIGIESKVYTVVINIVVGIVLGCQPIIGYNMGAQKFDRVKKLYLNILLCTVVVSAIALILFEAAPKAVVSIFGSPKDVDPDAYWEFATKLFRIFLSLVVFTCTIKMSSIFFQAIGKPIHAVVASLIRDIVCFIPLINILPLFYGVEGILYAAPIADAISIVVVVVLTLYIFKKVINPKNLPQFDASTVGAESAVAQGLIADENASAPQGVSELATEEVPVGVSEAQSDFDAEQGETLSAADDPQPADETNL